NDKGIVLQDDLLAAVFGKIHDQVRALGGSKQYALKRNWRGEQPLIGPNLVKAESVLKGEMIETSIRGVKHAKAVFARLDLKIGKELPIHQNGVAKDLRDPGRLRLVGDGVVKLAAGSQQAVEER